MLAEIRSHCGNYRLERLYGGATADVERLWYSIYVEELGYELPRVDHVARRIPEPFSTHGSLRVAKDASGAPAGTVLTVFGDHVDFGTYRELYGLTGSIAGVAFTTRLTILPQHRQRRLTLDLALATYSDALHAGIRTAHIDVQPHNVRLFAKLGYIERGPVEHPDYGSSVHMTLDLLDDAHLARVRSPFLPIATRYMKDACCGAA